MRCVHPRIEGEREMWTSPVGVVSSSVAAAGGRQIDALLQGAFSAAFSLAPRRVLDQGVTARARSAAESSSSSSTFGWFGNVRGPHSDSSLPRSRILVALASRRKPRGKSAPGVAVVDEEDDYDEWEDEDEDEDVLEDEEGEETAPMPFEEMRRWLRNKPSGFGEGKSYDTSVEDKLMEEIEKSRQAQAQNLQNLKNNAARQEVPKKKILRNLGDNEGAPVGSRVRILGLPRKKNVNRDLKLAFSGFPDLISIIPAVEGNKKTRDPICKGFAFVDFRTDEAAQKFVETYSRQSILFGRVEKPISCSIVVKRSEEISQPSLLPSTPAAAQESREEKRSREDNNTTSQPKEGIQGPRNGERAAGSHSLEQKKKTQVSSRKKAPRTRGDKAPQLSIGGSSLRLKVKERSILTGVLSKYGGQAAADSP